MPPTLVTRQQAAAWFGVAYQTIRSWERRFNIEPTGQDSHGCDLLPLRALSEVESRTRRTPQGRRRQRPTEQANLHAA